MWISTSTVCIHQWHGVFKCAFASTHALWTRIAMCEVCLHCVRYYICLELLTPTDSESLPRGRWMENGRRTRELWIAGRERERRTARRKERDKKWDRQEGNERQREEWMRLSDQLYRACSFAMWAADEKRWKLVSIITQPFKSAVLARARRHAGNPLNSSLISNTCRHGEGHRRAAMNDRGRTMWARSTCFLSAVVTACLTFPVWILSHLYLFIGQPSESKFSFSITCRFENVGSKLEISLKHWQHTSLIWQVKTATHKNPAQSECVISFKRCLHRSNWIYNSV